jgi:hypothetical protein
MAKLFPIGDIDGTSSGTIDGISYTIFEPNKSCKSAKTHSVLNTTYESQIILSRKKAEPFLNIAYEYDNIYAREFRQIEHFTDSVDDSLTSFLCVDWSKGITPTSVNSSWVVAMDNTNLYSIYASYKANRAILWTGNAWRLGVVSTVTTNTNIDLTTSYGDLSATLASTSANVYPVYDVRLTPNTTKTFKVDNHIPIEAVSVSTEGGYMYTGNVTFTSKYKV